MAKTKLADPVPERSMRDIVTDIVRKIGVDAGFSQVVETLKAQKIEFSESTVRQYVSVARSELGFSTPRGKPSKTKAGNATVADLMSAKRLAEELGMDTTKLLGLIQKLAAFGDLAKLEACLEALEELAG